MAPFVVAYVIQFRGVDRGRSLFTRADYRLAGPRSQPVSDHPRIGVACFAYIVAKRVAPLTRAQRDFRFDRPLTRLRECPEVLVRTVETSALQVRGNSPHSDFCGIPSSGGAGFHDAAGRSLGEFCNARPFRMDRPYLQLDYGLCRDHRLPLHGGGGDSAVSLQA